MINLRILFLVLSFLFSYVGYTQVTINGKLADEFSNAVGDAIITVNSTNNKILAYSNSSDKGDFSLSFTHTGDSLLLKVKTLGYRSITKKIANKTARFNFTLEEESFELQEMIIEAPPIKKRGDTLNYRVDSFARDYDRTISDVIKRMPGIEVKENGQILYQGTPINKYYIEGLDMLQGKYNLANESLPFKEVLDVQVIENHQPIRVLDSLTYSPNAALNIKLKNKHVLTGQVKAGAGAAPLLWDVNITPIYFTKKLQALFTYQTNNSGNDISNQLTTLSNQELINGAESVGRNNYLSIITPTIPGIPQKYWLDNNAHLLNFNTVKKLDNNYELKLFSSYLNDYQKQYGQKHTETFTKTDTLRLVQNIENRLSINAFSFGSEILRNSTDDYLLNRTELKINSDTEIGRINANNEVIENSLTKKYWSITNRFNKYIFLGKQLSEFNSLISYGVNNLQLQVTPGQFSEILNGDVFYNYVSQNIESKDFSTKSSIGFTKKLGDFTITPKVGIDFEQKIFDTNIAIDEVKRLNADFINDISWRYSRIFSNIGIQHQYKSWRSGINFPINYRLYDVKKNQLNEKNISFNRLNLEPSLYIIKDINSLWQVLSSAGIERKYGNFNQIPDGYILRNYNTLGKNNSIFPEMFNKNISLGFKYRNPLIATFAHATYTHTRNETNFTQSSSIDLISNTETSFLEKNNISNIDAVNATISKYFRYLKTKASISTSYSSENSQIFINDQFSKIKTINKAISFDIDYRLNDNISIVYKTNLSFYKNELDVNINFESSQFNNEVTVNWQFLEKHYLQFNTLLVNNTIFNTKNDHLLSNMVYRYKLKKYNIDFDVQVFNLFNAKGFTTNIIDSYSYQSNFFRLRPRQVLVTIRFSI